MGKVVDVQISKQKIGRHVKTADVDCDGDGDSDGYGDCGLKPYIFHFVQNQVFLVCT